MCALSSKQVARARSARAWENIATQAEAYFATDSAVYAQVTSKQLVVERARNKVTLETGLDLQTLRVSIAETAQFSNDLHFVADSVVKALAQAAETWQNSVVVAVTESFAYISTVYEY